MRIEKIIRYDLMHVAQKNWMFQAIDYISHMRKKMTLSHKLTTLCSAKPCKYRSCMYKTLFHEKKKLFFFLKNEFVSVD